jgi:ribosomal protein S19E (S16A)
MFSRSTLLLMLVAAGPGCKAAHYGSAAPSDYEMAATPDYDYGPVRTEAAGVDGEAMAEPIQASAMEKRSVSRRRVAQKEMASPAPRADSPTHAEPPVDTAESAEPAVDAPEHDPHDRQIVYTASMSLSVFNLEEATKTAEVLPESYGGYIHSMSRGHMIMRIPSKNLRTAMQDLEALGVVEQRSLQAQDVTAEYVDIDARVRVLEETQKQMVELLAKARTVDEALAVRQALDQITMELEVLKGRMRQLQNMISFSTLTVSLVERGPHVVTPSSRDPFPWVNDLGVEATEWK